MHSLDKYLLSTNQALWLSRNGGSNGENTKSLLHGPYILFGGDKQVNNWKCSFPIMIDAMKKIKSGSGWRRRGQFCYSGPGQPLDRQHWCWDVNHKAEAPTWTSRGKSTYRGWETEVMANEGHRGRRWGQIIREGRAMWDLVAHVVPVTLYILPAKGSVIGGLTEQSQ